MKQIILILSAAVLTSCSTTGGGPMAGVTPPKTDPPATIYLTGKPEWRTMADVKKAVGSKGLITGTRLDLKGNAISGKKIKHPKNSQAEDSIPLRISIDKFQLRNGIVEDIPGGILVSSKDTEFRSLKFLDIGEDALSNIKSKATGMKVINCRFYNDAGGDKSLQMNEVDGAEVSGNEVSGGQTGMRLGESSRKGRMEMTLSGNRFKNLPTGINADGDTRIASSGNRFDNVRQPWVKGGRVKVTEK